MSSKLKSARKEAGYTIEEVSEKINIRKQYIIGLEEEDYDALPGSVYVKGYTRIYCDFLKIDVPDLDLETKKTPAKIIVEDNNHNKRKYMIIFSLLMLILILIIYITIKARTSEVSEANIIKNDVISSELINELEEQGENDKTTDN